MKTDLSIMFVFMLVATALVLLAMYMFRKAMHTESFVKFFAYLLSTWTFFWMALMSAAPAVMLFWLRILPTCGNWIHP